MGNSKENAPETNVPVTKSKKDPASDMEGQEDF